jgi:hypothetical protein
MSKKGLPVQGYFNRAKVFALLVAALALFLLIRYMLRSFAG